MKPSMSKEDRALSQADRGYSAQLLIDNDVVMAWFAEYRASLVNKMLSAPISDDQTRRDAAVEIGVVDRLRNHLGHEASLGRKASSEIEKGKKL